MLSLGDRLATRGAKARQRYHRVHAETAAEVAETVISLIEHPQTPLLRGDEIAQLTGATGPRIGDLVDALAEEQAAGDVATREQAVAFVCR